MKNNRLPLGINKSLVEMVSEMKGEPDWMKKIRLEALAVFEQTPLPSWGPDLSGLKWDCLRCYFRPLPQKFHNWEEVPPEVRQTFENLGIPQAEQKHLAGVSNQFDSEIFYESLKKDLTQQGVIFTSMEKAVSEYEDLIRPLWGSLVKLSDNKFTALNTALWSGGSFIYVPEGVQVSQPLQAYFRINEPRLGQFERSLIYLEKGSSLHYIEGCSAPNYQPATLHAGVVEVFVGESAKLQYSTIQNWANNVYNLVTKKALVKKNGLMRWVDGNLGSGVNMKYPACFLTEEGAKGEMYSLAVAGKNQILDVGGRMVHQAPRTSSVIVSKSLCRDGGEAVFRNLVKIEPQAEESKAFVECDSLLTDGHSQIKTIPEGEVANSSSVFEHEATVSQIDEEQLFYLRCRGIKEDSARALLVNGFLEQIVRQFPLEYAVEINRLIESL